MNFRVSVIVSVLDGFIVIFHLASRVRGEEEGGDIVDVQREQFRFKAGALDDSVPDQVHARERVVHMYSQRPVGYDCICLIRIRGKPYRSSSSQLRPSKPDLTPFLRHHAHIFLFELNRGVGDDAGELLYSRVHRSETKLMVAGDGVRFVKVGQSL